MRIYVAGPMRGMPGGNFAAFDEAARVLRAMGHEVFSPAEADRALGVSEEMYEADFAAQDLAGVMREDLRQVLDADGVVLLDGWDQSSGARLERIVAASTGRRCLRIVDGLLVDAAPWDHEAIWTGVQVRDFLDS